MSKLSKSNVYAIKYLHDRGLNAEQISTEINLSIDKIQEIIDTIATSAPPNAKDLMITKTAVKNNNTVAVMTKEASMMNDHNRTKNTNQNNGIQKSTSHIFKPFKK